MSKITPERLAEIKARAEDALESVRLAREALAVNIPDLIAEVERLRWEIEDEKDRHVSTIALRDSMYAEKDADNTRLRAEMEAAKLDIRALSGEYKFCYKCKHHNGEGDTCSHPLRFSCDAENFYEWRGATENGGAK